MLQHASIIYYYAQVSKIMYIIILCLTYLIEKAQEQLNIAPKKANWFTMPSFLYERLPFSTLPVNVVATDHDHI